MRDLYGRDIGRVVSFRYSDIPDLEVQHPWPDDTTVSAGRGVVFVRGGGGSYRTLFMEVYPPGASFIRGEGDTPEACEDACWEQYQHALHCVGGNTHQFEPRGYRNGAGFCVHCGTFRANAFTGADLGQWCRVCGTGTTWWWGTVSDGQVVFECEDCHPPAPERLTMREALAVLVGGTETLGEDPVGSADTDSVNPDE